MKIFEFDKTSYNVHISEEVLFLKPFKELYTRDKSRSKDKALAELAYVWFFSDMASPYRMYVDTEERSVEIIKSIDGLPNTWKPDIKVKNAIEFYNNTDRSPIKELYDGAMIAADAVNSVFKNANMYIKESADPIAAAQKVVAALEKVPKVMDSLADAEKRLIREVEDKEGKKKGSRSFSLYEDGLPME